MKYEIGMWLLILIIFTAGFGWGQWYANMRAKAKSDSDSLQRLVVSMPMDAEQAKNVFSLLHNLVEAVDSEQLAQR